MVRGLVSGLLLAASACGVRAETVATLPAPTGYVDDFAGVLSPEVKQSLEDLCTRVDKQAHAQIAVVTVKTITDDKGGEESIEEFATALEEKWKVGPKGTDRGVLMLLVMAPNAQSKPRGRIEVGYGLEGILPDGKVGDIGREMAPLAQKGDYNDAVPLGVREIAGIIAADAGVSVDAAPVVHQYHRVPVDQGSGQSNGFTIVLLILAAIFVIIMILTGHAGMLFWLVLNLLGSGGGGGGRGGGDNDSGGGGFGGFGGGSSGGGGASGGIFEMVGRKRRRTADSLRE